MQNANLNRRPKPVNTRGNLLLDMYHLAGEVDYTYLVYDCGVV